MNLQINEENNIIKKVMGNNGSYTIKVTPRYFNCFICKGKFDRTRQHNLVQDDSIKNLVVPKQCCNKCTKDIREIQKKIVRTKTDYIRKW